MTIAIMLRGVDKQGGTGVYAKNLVPRLLELGYQHEWTLLYQAHDQLESFQLPDYARVVDWHRVKAPQRATAESKYQTEIERMYATRAEASNQ